MSYFDELLDIDPLALAEKLTGKSYKDDEQTSNLGIALALEHVQRKRDELSVRDDTYYGATFEYVERIFTELGFEVVHTHQFPGSHASDTFKVLWHPDGVLGTIESFTWDDNSTPSINNAKIYYNWRRTTTEHDLWHYISSGRIVDDNVISGDHDVREGLRHIMGKFRGNGEFLSQWVDQPHMWLIDYSQPKELKSVDWSLQSNYYRNITQSLITDLPEHVRATITPEKESN